MFERIAADSLSNKAISIIILYKSVYHTPSLVIQYTAVWGQ